MSTASKGLAVKRLTNGANSKLCSANRATTSAAPKARSMGDCQSRSANAAPKNARLHTKTQYRLMAMSSSCTDNKTRRSRGWPSKLLGPGRGDIGMGLCSGILLERLSTNAWRTQNPSRPSKEYFALPTQLGTAGEEAFAAPHQLRSQS